MSPTEIPVVREDYAKIMANITLSHEAIHYPTVPAHEILTHYATVDLVDWLKIEGDCRIDDDGSFRVYISDPLCEYSYEWPYAHELGHIVLGHCTRSLRQVSKQQEAVFSREADIFAAELLMPAAWVVEQYAQYDIRNFRDLRHYVQGYGVSWYVMKRRLMELGLCAEDYWEWL